jgi:hypothetical protein
VRRFLYAGVTALRRFALPTRKNCHPIVGLLPESYAAVSAFFERVYGKLVIGALGLLQTKDIRLNRFQPFNQMRHAGKYRINVPSGDFHLLWIRVLEYSRQKPSGQNDPRNTTKHESSS